MVYIVLKYGLVLFLLGYIKIGNINHGDNCYKQVGEDYKRLVVS